MIFDNTRKDFSLVVLGALCLVVLYWAKAFIVAELPDAHHGVAIPLFDLSVFSGRLGVVVSACLCFLSSLILYRICVIHQIIPNREHLPVFLFICINGAFPNYQHIETHIANLFLLLFLNRLMSLYQVEYDFAGTFLAGFYLMIASFFIDEALMLFFPAFIGLFLFKSVKWRDIVVFISGFIYLVFILAVFSYFKFADPLYPFLQYFSDAGPFFMQKLQFSVSQIVCASYILLLVLVEILRVGTRSVSGLKQKTIMVNTALFWIFVFGCIGVLFFSSQGLLILSIPLSTILANFLSTIRRKWLERIMAYLFFALTILAYYF